MDCFVTLREKNMFRSAFERGTEPLAPQRIRPWSLQRCHHLNPPCYHDRLATARLATDCSEWQDHCHASDAGSKKRVWHALRIRAKSRLQRRLSPPVSGLYPRVRTKGTVGRVLRIFLPRLGPYKRADIRIVGTTWHTNTKELTCVFVCAA